MKSKRKDHRGHWPAGRPRSTLTAAQIAAVLRKINRALEDQSMMQVARTLGISDTQIARITRGHNLPSEATYERVMQRL
jgi:transcriptional regulator with XRE-family HTH domain